MNLDLFQYTRTNGWNLELQPGMDSDKTLVLVFGSSSYVDDTDVFNDLKKACSKAYIVGCSTAGEIFGTEINDDTLSMAVMRFKDTDLNYCSFKIKNAEESYSTGLQITKALNKSGLKGIFVLSDGLLVNGSELIRGINQELPASVIVTGGLAGDGDKFEKTWVLKNGLPAQGYVTAVAYYGDNIVIGHGSKGGWSSFGPKRKITKAKNNILYELDGEPALQLYKKYLGERAAGLPATALLFPLAIHNLDGKLQYMVRTILSVDEDNQSMIFAGNIPENHYAQLMRADFEHLIDGAYDAAAMASPAKATTGDTLNIAISCVGRRLLLGERCEDEVEATLEVLPEGTRQIGFYSYGEISPFVSGHFSHLHNQTMTLTTISESC